MMEPSVSALAVAYGADLALGDPRWWDEFLRLTQEQGVAFDHPGRGGVCQACMAIGPNWSKNGFPYQADHNRTS